MALEPAASIVKSLGGASVVAEAIGRHRMTVYRWMRPRSRGGTGGLIPAHFQVTLLAWAAERGKPLAPEDFFPKAAQPKTEAA